MPSTPASVIREVREDWLTDEAVETSARAINTGSCMEFANEVLRRCNSTDLVLKRTGDDDVLGPPENPQYDMEPFHVWLFDGQLHYDAEVPDGVDHWRQLPFFQRYGY